MVGPDEIENPVITIDGMLLMIIYNQLEASYMHVHFSSTLASLIRLNMHYLTGDRHGN
jgi:hypothetical protein